MSNPENRTGTEAAALAGMIDAYAPARIAHLVENIGVAKANLALVPMTALGFLAGFYIAFGAMLFTFLMTEPIAAFGLARWIGGLGFSVGLVLVVIGGAELFTGNTLMTAGWADGKVSTAKLLRNWAVVYLANAAGSVAAAAMVAWCGIYGLGGGAVAETAIGIATGKAALPFDVAFARGVMCNILVCLAIWLSLSSHRVSGKILAIVLPISTFVALGFEHSIANMYFMPVAMLHGADVGLGALAANLVPVTLGNIVGGGLGVAGSYWLIYLRGRG